MKTTREQRGLYLAATEEVEHLFGSTYKIRGYTVNGACSCADYKWRHRKITDFSCKHMQAADFIAQHGLPSVGLAMLMAVGGGSIERFRRGGIGDYHRLEGNSLLGKPLALEEADGKLWPAKIYADHTGWHLEPLTSKALCERYLPELVELAGKLAAFYRRLVKEEA